jgi:hypothetical protein
MYTVFWRVTDVVGAPEEAAHDIWRALLAGRARALRRRYYDDSDFKDEELPREFWRGVKLIAARDNRDRETVGYILAEGVASREVGPGCFFYLFEADVRALWALEPTQLESTEPFRTGAQGRGPTAKEQVFCETPDEIEPSARRSRRRRESGGTQARRARTVLRRMFPDGNYPSEEELSTPDLRDRFITAYADVEGKESQSSPPSRYGIPSMSTMLREIGRKE